MKSEWENGVKNVIFSYFYILKNYLCNEPFLLIYDIGIKINTKKKNKEKSQQISGNKSNGNLSFSV